MQTLAQLGQSIWSRQLATLGLGSRTTCSNTSTTDDESCTHALNVSDRQSIRSEANKEPGVNHPVATSANWQAQAGSRDTEPISSSTGPTRHFSAELICGSIDRPEVWMQRRQRSSRCRGTDPRGWPWTLSHRREPMAGAGGFRMKRDGAKWVAAPYPNLRRKKIHDTALKQKDCCTPESNSVIAAPSAAWQVN